MILAREWKRLFGDLENFDGKKIIRPDSILDILKVLVEHEDIKAFFIKLAGLLKAPVFKEFSKKV